MPKKPRAYYRPETVEEAVRLLAQPGTVPLAGGTGLLAGASSAAVVDLQALELDFIRPGQGHLLLGAMARLAQLEAFLQGEGAEAGPGEWLRQAVHRAGPNTLRNAATLGGTIAARTRDSELLAALVLLEAELLCYGGQERPLLPYLAGEGGDAPLILAVRLPWRAGQGRSARVARTPADSPIVSVSLWQAEGGAPRLAATGTGEVVQRLWQAEAALAPGITPDSVARAAAAAQAACRHPGDFRGDAAYRAAMAASLTRRLLLDL